MYNTQETNDYKDRIIARDNLHNSNGRKQILLSATIGEDLYMASVWLDKSLSPIALVNTKNNQEYIIHLTKKTIDVVINNDAKTSLKYLLGQCLYPIT